jgi:hypothetical protein
VNQQKQRSSNGRKCRLKRKRTVQRIGSRCSWR